MTVDVLVQFHEPIPPGWGVERIVHLVGTDAAMHIEPVAPAASDDDLVTLFAVTLVPAAARAEVLFALREAPDVASAEPPPARATG